MAKKDERQVIKIKGWLSTTEAAELLGVRQSYIRYLTALGYMPRPAAGIGRAALYKESDIREYRRTHPRVGQNVGAEQFFHNHHENDESEEV